MAKKVTSSKFALNNEDAKRWALNVVQFCLVPTALAFLTAYQTNLDPKYAFGVAYGTAFTSVIDLGKKFLAGN